MKHIIPVSYTHLLFIVCSEEDAEAVTAFIGKEIQVDWEKQDTPMVSRRILVTKTDINGKKLGSMHFRSLYGVNVTRINRSGMDLFADPNLVLQVGDRVMVVGQQDAVERVASVLGNQLKRLDTPNIVKMCIRDRYKSVARLFSEQKCMITQTDKFAAPPNQKNAVRGEDFTAPWSLTASFGPGKKNRILTIIQIEADGNNAVEIFHSDGNNFQCGDWAKMCIRDSVHTAA